MRMHEFLKFVILCVTALIALAIHLGVLAAAVYVVALVLQHMGVL